MQFWKTLRKGAPAHRDAPAAAKTALSAESTAPDLDLQRYRALFVTAMTHLADRIDLESNDINASSLRAPHTFMAGFLHAFSELWMSQGQAIDPPHALPHGFDDVLRQAFAVALDSDFRFMAEHESKAGFNSRPGVANGTSDALKELYGEMTGSLPACLPPHARKYMCVDPATLMALDRVLPEASGNPLTALIYETEPGYLRGMVEGWKLLGESSSAPVDSALIAALHRSFALESSGKVKAPFHDRADVEFKLVHGYNCTPAGTAEFKQFAAGMKKAIPRYRIEPEDAGFKIVRPAVRKGKLQHIIDGWLADYNQARDGKAVEDPDADLRRIVGLCQKLERLHPFLDGNCRIFGNLLLNHLLAQEGHPPTALRNPNVIDGYSLEEVVNEVKEGQARVQALAAEADDAQPNATPTSNRAA